MHIIGFIISLCGFLLEAAIVIRCALNKVFRSFPLFYSYITYATATTVVLYAVYWFDVKTYASAFWINYLINLLAEFAVLVEISDHIFKPFVAIRSLGRALTLIITAILGVIYISPTIFASEGRREALLDFAMRASVVKAVILIALFMAARRYRSELGKNVGGLMLGFSIYLALTIANLSVAQVVNPAAAAALLWILEPLATALCLLVWTISLWQLAPVTVRGRADGRDSESVALQLARFNSELSKILHK